MRSNLLHRLILTITVVVSSLFVCKYSTRLTTFYGDALGYYMYLPATFIYHTLPSVDQLPAERNIDLGVLIYCQQLREQKTKKGYVCDQYTYGIALMEAPFFLLAHTWESITGTPITANGFTASYNNMIKAGDIVYAILGLLLIYKILKRYFTPSISLLGAMAVFWGTNLFWFTIFQSGMSHVPLFFLYALLIYIVIRLHEKPSPLLFITAGLISGLITIIRPTDILCLLIPLLYNVYNKETLAAKWQFIKANSFNIILMAIAFAIPIIPQLLYWKAVAGSFVYYSYGTQSFNWLHPKIIEGLFYYSNGWLPYSPIMIFALAGTFLYTRPQIWKWSLWVILPLYIYIIYSWYCFNYINGLGSRPMIHMYPLLAIPLSAFFNFIAMRKAWVKAMAAIVCLFFIAMNVCYSMQQSEKVLWSEESNMAFNMRMLFRMRLTYNDLLANDMGTWQPDTSKLVNIGTLATENYADSTSARYEPDTVAGGKLYHMHDQEIHESILLYCDKSKLKGARWFKCSGRFMYPEAPDYYRHMWAFAVSRHPDTYCKIENKIGDWRNNPDYKGLTLFDAQPNKWGDAYFFIKVPSGIRDSDVIKVFMWSINKKDIYMKDIKIDLYK